MKFLFYIAALPLAYLLHGCGGASQGELPVLNIEKAIDDPRTFDLRDIAQKIDLIPLDDSDKNSLIGSIGDLQESKYGFYICAGLMTPVQHFDKTGKFVSTIGSIGRGPEETSYIFRMAVDHERGDVYIDGSNRVAAYDAAGKMFARNDSISSSQMAYHNGQLLSLKSISLLNPDAYDGDRIDFLEIFSRDLKREGSIDAVNLGPFDIYNTNASSGAYNVGSSPFISDNGENMIVRQGRNDTLYHYIEGALKPVLLLDLGMYAPPSAAFGHNPVEPWNERYYSVDNVWEGSRYIIVTAGNRRQRQPRRLIFDKENPSSGFSATGGKNGEQGIFLDGIAFVPFYIRDNRLTGYIDAIDIADNAASITDPGLKEIAATITENSNPVLVVATLD